MSNNYPECWKTSDVCIWLKEKGFGIYVDSFKRHKIDGEALLMLTEKDLKEELQVDVSLHDVILLWIMFASMKIICMISVLYYEGSLL